MKQFLIANIICVMAMTAYGCGGIENNSGPNTLNSEEHAPVICTVHKNPLVKETRYAGDENVRLRISYSRDIVQYFYVATASKKTPHIIAFPDLRNEKTPNHNVAIEISYCEQCEAEYWKTYENFKELPEDERERQFTAAIKIIRDHAK